MIEGSSGPEELPFLSELDTGPLFGDNPASNSSESATSASTDLDRKQAGGGAASSASDNVIAPISNPLSQDEKIQQLQALGFSRDEVELALSQADGEVNLAATLLLSSRQG